MTNWPDWPDFLMLVFIAWLVALPLGIWAFHLVREVQGIPFKSFFCEKIR